MSGLVLDASFIIARIFEEETAAGSEAVYLQVLQDGAYVPQLWHFEARNALIIGERRRRISRAQADQAAAMFNSLPVTTDESPDLDAAMTLAREHGLTFYDALYLELTLRRQAVLVSLDADLLRAARAEGAAAL